MSRRSSANRCARGSRTWLSGSSPCATWWTGAWARGGREPAGPPRGPGPRVGVAVPGGRPRRPPGPPPVGAPAGGPGSRPPRARGGGSTRRAPRRRRCATRSRRGRGGVPRRQRQGDTAQVRARARGRPWFPPAGLSGPPVGSPQLNAMEEVWRRAKLAIRDPERRPGVVGMRAAAGGHFRRVRRRPGIFAYLGRAAVECCTVPGA